MFSGVPIQRLHSKTECVTAVQQKAVPIQIFLQMQRLRPLRIQRIDPAQRERERERESSEFCKSILRVQRNTPSNACRAELGQYPLIMHIEKRAIKFWKHLKMSDPNSYHFKALKNHEVNPERSPLIQMILKLQTQTNTTNNIQHQDTETSIHKIHPNQIIKAQQEKYLTYWKETTEKQSKLECYLALNRDYTTA